MNDANDRRAMIGAREDPLIFASDLITHPISLILTLALALMLLAQTGVFHRRTAD